MATVAISNTRPYAVVWTGAVPILVKQWGTLSHHRTEKAARQTAKQWRDDVSRIHGAWPSLFHFAVVDTRDGTIITNYR